jgi:hypothetical protein
VGSGVPNKGPLKITIRSTSVDQTWRTIWEIFPTYARLTVQLAPVAYWFQYEGTPGGVLEPASDFIVRSTGEQTLANVSWAADITGEEWMFATDPTVGRSLYMIQYNDADTTTDYYANSNNLMTILAFGRNGSSRFLTQVPQQFAFGLVDATTLDGVRPTVHDISKSLGFSTGPAEKRPFDPSPTPTTTAEASSTPTATASASPTTTVTPTATATATEISTSSPTSVNSPTPTEMVTASPTITLAATMSASPSPTGTFVATASATPTGPATAVASPTPTGEATPTPKELIFLPLALN